VVSSCCKLTDLETLLLPAAYPNHIAPGRLKTGAMHYPALNHVTGHFTIFLLHCELQTSTDMLSSCCSAFRFLITPLHFTILWMNAILPETTETICRILSGMVLQWDPTVSSK